jgi:hypothetical protein
MAPPVATKHPHLPDAALQLYIAGTRLGHHGGHELQPVSLASGPDRPDDHDGITHGMVSHGMLAEICDEWLEAEEGDTMTQW